MATVLQPNDKEHDGYGNSRVVKFDREGKFLKAWGRYGSGQIFDADGVFLKEWTGIGYPYGLFITPDQHVWMIDGGYDRIVELDQDGRVLGAFGEPGHAPGQFAWGHFLAVGKDRTIYAADVLNWRFQVLARTASGGEVARYVPSRRRFWDRIESTGWSTRSTAPKN